MKPRHIAYIIWIVIALLGVVCWAVPAGGFSIGGWTLRWPTLAEALDLEVDSTLVDELGILNTIDVYNKKTNDDTILQDDNEIVNKFTTLLKSTRNLILTGAPGTGKTYLAK